MSVLVALLSIPVAIELLAALLSFRDLVVLPGARATAIERLIVPLLLLAALIWLAAPDHVVAMAVAFAMVILWQIIVHRVLRIVVHSERFTARSVDTDEAIGN